MFREKGTDYDRKQDGKTRARDMKSTELRAGEEMDRAMWSRKIISHTGDHIQREKLGEKKNKNYGSNCRNRHCSCLL